MRKFNCLSVYVPVTLGLIVDVPFVEDLPHEGARCLEPIIEDSDLEMAINFALKTGNIEEMTIGDYEIVEPAAGDEW